MQQSFRKSGFFSSLVVGLILFAVILALGLWLRGTPNRADRPARVAAVRFVPVPFEPSGFAPLRLAGAWQVEVDDPRFGGVSALAIDQGRLLALTDSGSLVRLPMPGGGSDALLSDLPAGPGAPGFKANRDSEALARDPAGRGWWVAFEQWHQLWLYDPQFNLALAKIDLGANRWSDNKGVEAMIANGDGLLLFSERGDEWLSIRGGHVRSHAYSSRFGYISDGVRTPDGRLLLVARKMALAGLAKRLVEVKEAAGAVELRSLARLELGPLDNVEAIATEPTSGGGMRFWLMTDNDFQRRKQTLLVALDLKPPIARRDESPAQSAGLSRKPTFEAP